MCPINAIFLHFVCHEIVRFSDYVVIDWQEAWYICKQKPMANHNWRYIAFRNSTGNFLKINHLISDMKRHKICGRNIYTYLDNALLRLYSFIFNYKLNGLLLYKLISPWSFSREIFEAKQIFSSVLNQHSKRFCPNSYMTTPRSYDMDNCYFNGLYDPKIKDSCVLKISSNSFGVHSFMNEKRHRVHNMVSFPKVTRVASFTSI